VYYTRDARIIHSRLC